MPEDKDKDQLFGRSFFITIGVTLMVTGLSAFFNDLTWWKTTLLCFFFLFGVAFFLYGAYPHWFAQPSQEEVYFDTDGQLKKRALPPKILWTRCALWTLGILLFSGGSGFAHYSIFNGQKTGPVVTIAVSKPITVSVPATPASRQNEQTNPPSGVTPPTTPVRSSIRPYDFSGSRRKTLLALLKPPLDGANTIRVGCLGANDRSCLAAGQFLLILSEAGWSIEENRVFKLEESIPTDGVSIVSVPEPGPPQPPHLGRWHTLNTSELTIAFALLSVGTKQIGSSDPTLKEGETGVYFGIEPEAIKFDKLGLRAAPISILVGEIRNIEKLSDGARKETKEFMWNDAAEQWLRANANKAVAQHFREIVGQKEKSEYFQSQVTKEISAIITAHKKETE